MRIDYLEHHQCHLPTVAAWQQAEFSYLAPAVTMEQRIDRLRATAQRQSLPLTLIALDEEGMPVGAASILIKTITHPHLSPWLSSVVVPPASRGQGIASALSLQAATVAGQLGFDALHLFTPRNESLYQRLGWEESERSIVNGVAITIMSRSTKRSG